MLSNQFNSNGIATTQTPPLTAPLRDSFSLLSGQRLSCGIHQGHQGVKGADNKGWGGRHCLDDSHTAPSATPYWCACACVCHVEPWKLLLLLLPASLHIFLPQLCLCWTPHQLPQVSLVSDVLSLRSLASLICVVLCPPPTPQRLETDLSYWMDQARSRDQGRQHQYDENAPIGPRDQSSYRHGADVNYDYYWLWCVSLTRAAQEGRGATPS